MILHRAEGGGRCWGSILNTQHWMKWQWWQMPGEASLMVNVKWHGGGLVSIELLDRSCNIDRKLPYSASLADAGEASSTLNLTWQSRGQWGKCPWCSMSSDMAEWRVKWLAPGEKTSSMLNIKWHSRAEGGRHQGKRPQHSMLSDVAEQRGRGDNPWYCSSRVRGGVSVHIVWEARRVSPSLLMRLRGDVLAVLNAAHIFWERGTCNTFHSPTKSGGNPGNPQEWAEIPEFWGNPGGIHLQFTIKDII